MKNRYILLALMAAFQGIQGAAASGAGVAPKKEASAEESKKKQAAGTIRLVVRNELGQDILLGVNQKSNKRYFNIDHDKIAEIYLSSSSDEDRYELEVQRQEKTGLLGTGTRTVTVKSPERLAPNVTNNIVLEELTLGDKKVFSDRSIKKQPNSPYVPQKIGDVERWSITNSTKTNLYVTGPYENGIFVPETPQSLAVNQYRDGWDKEIVIEVHKVLSNNTEANITTFIVPWNELYTSADIGVQEQNEKDFRLSVSGEGIAPKEFIGTTNNADEEE